jgi:hypothetical protein
MVAMNGIMRLIWTYLYRCHESSSTATSKLEGVLNQFFPPNKLAIFPADDHLEPLVFIVHFVLSRHFDYGTEFVLELMQENSLRSGNVTNIGTLVSAERLSVAVQAILLTLHCIEREEAAPTWPSRWDMSELAAWDDYPTSSEYPSEALIASKQGVLDLLSRLGPALTTIVVHCAHAVGKMCLFDDQYSLTTSTVTYEEAHNYIVRRHPEGSVMYHAQFVPQIIMLETCFRSWPRLLHSSLTIEDALDMLLHGMIHVEPSVADVASQALRRFMGDTEHARVTFGKFYDFLFGPTQIKEDATGLHLVCESARLRNLWLSLLDGWTAEVVRRPLLSLTDDQRASIALRLDEMQAGALFLLTQDNPSIAAAGTKIMRLALMLDAHVARSTAWPQPNILGMLRGSHDEQLPVLQGFDELVGRDTLKRLQYWRESSQEDAILRLAGSNDRHDRQIWKFAFARLLELCVVQPDPALERFRETLIAAATKYHPVMTSLSSMATRAPGAGLNRTPALGGEKDASRYIQDYAPSIEQWALWTKLLAVTATVVDVRSQAPAREHARAPSLPSVDPESMTTSRAVYRYMTPFLESEHTIFRSAGALCIGSLPAAAYSQLLEDLSALAGRHFYDDARLKASPAVGRTRRYEQFYTAVARVYFLTAHHLQSQRSAQRQTTLTHVLKFVRYTQSFLAHPEVREWAELQRLRRYFCGILEQLFDGLATISDSDRFIPSHMHLSLYRLCEEWCQFGAQSTVVKQRLVAMQMDAARAEVAQRENIERFQTETRRLSNAAVGALASLCVCLSCLPCWPALTPYSTRRTFPLICRPDPRRRVHPAIS